MRNKVKDILFVKPVATLGHIRGRGPQTGMADREPVLWPTWLAVGGTK